MGAEAIGARSNRPVRLSHGPDQNGFQVGCEVNLR